MKKQRRMMAVVGLVLGMSTMAAPGQGAAIASFPGNGRLIWTNAVNANALYRVGWASAAAGPWHRFTDQPINPVDAFTNSSFSRAKPVLATRQATALPPVMASGVCEGCDAAG